jgi:dTDP-glucose pyrophosphorylase
MTYNIANNNISIKKVLDLLEFYKIIFFINNENFLVGALTNGDVRRSIEKNININNLVDKIINKDIIYAYIDESLEEKIKKIDLLPEDYQFLPIINRNKKLEKIVIKKDLLKKVNSVVLMAGGLGNRLGEITKNIPKPMLHIGNKPILEIIIDGFKKYHFNDFYISVNYKADVIKKHFRNGDDFNVNIKYINESKRLGTAGCLSLINENLNEPFFVMNGDILTDENFEQILNYHIKNKFEATMCTSKYEIKIPYGVILSDVDNKIISIKEKPIQKFNINAGIYVLNPSVLKYIPKDTFFDMPTLFEKLNELNLNTGIYNLETSWLDIGEPSDYYLAKKNK